MDYDGHLTSPDPQRESVLFIEMLYRDRTNDHRGKHVSLLQGALRGLGIEDGTVDYHGLSGGLPVYRWTYRQIGVHNGPTIVPVELIAGLVERSTPALAEALLSGYANKPSREVERAMQADLRRPPSRKAIEGFVKRAGKRLRQHVDTIEPVLRAREQLPDGVRSLSLGLDRTTVPMHGLIELADAAWVQFWL